MVMELYCVRWQIEEEFRDFKNEHVGLRFSANRSEHGEQLGMLLLIACLTSFLLRLIREIAHARHLE